MKFPEVSDTMDTGPGNVSLEAGVESMWLEFVKMAPRNMVGRWFFTLTLVTFELRQFSASTSGNVPLLNDLLPSHIYTFGPPFYLGRYGRNALVYVRRHDFICYAITRPVCLFGGGFGARNVV